MTSKTLNFYRQFFFISILTLGFLYFASFVFLTPKVYSGFIMQIIFFIDCLVVHPQDISPLIFRPDFLFQIFFGIFWSYLLFLIFKAAISVLNQIKLTRQFIWSLDITRVTSQYTVFNSLTPQAFTVGFSHPQIYLSKNLLDISSPSEISSILFHEQSHVKHHDPLKNLFTNFIKNILPPFPLKSWIFGQYLTLIEISCDHFSQHHFSHPTSLISALLKIQQHSTPQFATGFSAQSERIKILVGQKQLAYKSTILANFTVVALLFIISGSLSRSDIFYQCNHLLLCLENLITRDHIITTKTAESQHCLTSQIAP